MQTQNHTGGVRHVEVGPDHDGQRVDNFLAARLGGVPRSAVYRMIRTGQVRINGRRCKPATRLTEGDQVRIPPARYRQQGEAVVPGGALEQIEASIVYRDADMLVLDKPAGMAVHAGSGLPWGVIDGLRTTHAGEFIELVHRLDRETSGCLVLARNGAALQHLSAQFREGRVGKHYLCLLDGRLPQPVLEVDAPLRRGGGTLRRVDVADDGKPALTRFRMLQPFDDCTYAEAELLTGRMHQIRAHARHIGMPLAGDRRYAEKPRLKVWRRRGLKRMFLHAHRVTLSSPAGQEMVFDCPLPSELRAVLDALSP